jgi:hypothetical protein
MMFDSIDSLRGLEDERRRDEEDDAAYDFAFEEVKEEKPFLGMTAVERMFLSIFVFMNVAVIGIALLLATGRLVF